MDFDFTEDQLALREGARELLDDLAAPARVRAHTDVRRTRSTPASGPRWSSRAGSGIEVPEADGGIGLGAVEVAVLVEELGTHAAPAPFVPTVLALDAFARGGRDRMGRTVARPATSARASRGTSRSRCRTRPRPTSPSSATDDGVYAVELADAAAARSPRWT